uniref:uncharacterized protein isoform X2 n=1 Tax=Myxine glutinosa TaxID=7769 RepID=UPI00358F3CA9
MLPNGTLQISRVHLSDSGFYRCLKQTRQVPSAHSDSTPSLCASREQHRQQGDSAAQDHWHTAFLLSISALPQQEYKVSVHTGSRLGSGTDAKVFINLCGEITCVESELKTSTRNLFEKGQKDHFTINGPYLGHLTKLKIWHDGAGVLPSWFLDKVTVKEPLSGMTDTFTCNCWIDRNSRRTLSAQGLAFQKKKTWCKTFLTENHEAHQNNSGESEDDQIQTFLTPSTTEPSTTEPSISTTEHIAAITSSWEFLWTLMGVGLFLLGFLLITTIVLVSRKFCFYKENLPLKTSIQKQTRNQVKNTHGKNSKTTCKLRARPTHIERVLKNKTEKVETNSTALYVNVPVRPKTTETRRTETRRHETARAENLGKSKRKDGETRFVATYENWRQNSKL